MKKVTKIIAFLLAIGLLFSAYGCQGGNNAAETGGNTEKVKDESSGIGTEEGNTDTVASSDPTEVKLPELELKSKTIKILRSETAELTSEQQKTLDILKENYDAEVEWVMVPLLSDQLLTRITQMVVSGDSPDLVPYEPFIHPIASVKKVVQPADQYFDFNAPLFKEVKEMSDQFLWENKHYAIITGKSIYYYIWYNKKLFEENGVETPLEYYKRGEWTWDTLKKLAEEMTLDTNGDGKTDVYGLGRCEGSYVSLGSTGMDYVKFADDGKVINNMSDPRFKWVAEFNASLRLPGWEYPLNMCYDQFQKGELAMFEGGIWGGKQFKELVESGSASVVPVPKNSNADKWYIYNVATGYYIPEGAKNPEGAMAFLACDEYKKYQQKNSPEWDQIRKDDMKENWGITDAEIEMVDFAVNECTPSFLIHRGIGGWMVQSYRMWDEFNQGVPFATVVDKYSPVLDAEINKMYEK